ncbi:MAG: glucose/sorbosone dehydrogenase-like protein [Solirubrobacterales bacterium]|nr:glucose/sorbosone dehydrogenase-like protein [Solirubrobacterales bacterium]
MLARRPLAAVLLALATLSACGGEDDGAAATSGAAAATSGLRLVKVGSFTEPVYVTAPPRDERRLFVVEQAGRIKVVRGGRTLPTPFLDVGPLVTSGGEQGLLAVAFPPDHARTGLFYVYYTDRDRQQRVVEYRRRNADRADPRSARLVLRMADAEANHNGGQMLFGPDGKLYIATGDGGGGGDQHGTRGNAQDLGSPLGKLLRIDPRRKGSRRYTVPQDNPFVGRAGARPEVWALGLRNPWRFTFDRGTGDLTIGDVGQDEVEEVDHVRGPGRGANFGWRPREGSRVAAEGEHAPGAIDPVLEKQHDDDWCSITGGVVVRDPALRSLRGTYLYGDFCLGKVRGATLSPSRATNDRDLGLPKVEGLASFGEDARGRVYVVSLSGTVSRLAAR